MAPRKKNSWIKNPRAVVRYEFDLNGLFPSTMPAPVQGAAATRRRSDQGLQYEQYVPVCVHACQTQAYDCKKICETNFPIKHRPFATVKEQSACETGCAAGRRNGGRHTADAGANATAVQCADACLQMFKEEHPQALPHPSLVATCSHACVEGRLPCDALYPEDAAASLGCLIGRGLLTNEDL